MSKIPQKIALFLLATLGAGALVSCMAGNGPSGAVEYANRTDDVTITKIADPLGGDSVDPVKAVDRELRLIFKKITVLCVNTKEGRVRVRAEGHLKIPDGAPRILRVVDRDEKEFTDVITDSNGDVVFDTLAGYELDFKLYVMPKEYQPTLEIPLNTRSECKNGACKPGDGKRPKIFNLAPLDICKIDAPECVRYEVRGELELHQKGVSEIIQNSNEEPENEHHSLPCLKFPPTGPLDPIPQP